MVTTIDRAVEGLNKAIQNYNRQIRHTKRLFTALATPPSKDDLIDLEASLVDYLATVDINYKVVTESGIEEFDDVVATIRSNHEQMIASLRLSEPEQSNAHAPAPSRRSSLGSVATSTQSVQMLAEALALSMRINRIGPLDVEIFVGNPLEYVSWEVAFKNLIECSAVPESDRLHYLRKYVGGPAKEAIRGYFLLSNTGAAYCKAMSVLKNRFGSDFAIAESFRERLETWPIIRDSDYKGIQKYADFLGQCLTAMEKIEELSILNDSKQNVLMASKLPGWLSNSWKRRAVGCRNENGRYPKFEEFVNFLNTECDILNDPFMSKISDVKGKERNSSHKVERTPYVRQTSATPTFNDCLMCGSKAHKASDCSKLNEKSYDEVRKPWN